MAAVTPSTVTRHSMGDFTVHVARFANSTDHGDTWASGIPGICGIVASQEDASGTQASTGAGASWSSTTITIRLAENNSAVTLLVFSKS